MKLSYLLRGAVLGTATVAAFTLLMSYSNSPAPGGYTGSPSDGRTCGTNGGCHGGGATAQAGMIITDIPTDGYEPGMTYNISVKVSETGRGVFGFSFTAQDNSGTLQGTLIAGAGTELSSDNKYMSHKRGTTSATDSKTWPFQWTAPAAGSGDVMFYTSGNAGDNNGMASGDIIYTDMVTVQEKTSGATGIQVNVEEEELFSFFPNPSSDFIRVQSERPGLLTVYNLKGELMIEQYVNSTLESIDVQSLEYGMYVVNFDNGQDALFQQTMIKY